MDIPFVTHLRHKILGTAPWGMKSPRFLSVKNGSSTDDLMRDVVVRFCAEIFFEQRITSQELEAGKDSALQHARERAVRAIAREAYGPIERELHEVLVLLWEDGMSQSEAAKRINAVLPILRGEQA